MSIVSTQDHTGARATVRTQRPVLAAVILAAGFSSRMGSFKPLLPLAGKSAVDWAIDGFRDAGIAAVATVAGYGSAVLAPELARRGVAMLTNPDPGRGMFSSVQAGVRALPPEVDACFLLPVDVPLVRPATLTALAAHYDASRPAILYPSFRGQRGHPPLIDRRLFAQILSSNTSQNLRAILQAHQAQATELEVIDESILLDMDTPADYQRLAHLAAQRHLPTVAECEAILARCEVPEDVRRHCRRVATVATALAHALTVAGVPVDGDQVASAALLHDVAKGQARHAETGARIAVHFGFPALAKAIRQHMDLCWQGDLPDVSALVFLADKLVREDQLVSLEERFRPAFARFAAQPEALAGAHLRHDTAHAIGIAIECLTGRDLPDILKDCGAAPCP